MSSQTQKVNNLVTAQLRCSVFAGMFADEYAIEIAVEGNQKASLFVSKSELANVDMSQHTGLLRVKSFKDQPNYAVLPSTTLEQGNNVVKVSEDLLVFT